jgi:signal peptidase
MTAGTQREHDTPADLLGQPDVSMRSSDAPAKQSRSFVEGRFYLGLIGLFVSLAALWLTLFVVVPALAGWSSVAIVSDSMAPSVRAGDVVVAAPHNGIGLGPGSVVVFEDPAGDGLVTHRIAAVNEDGTYLTKGDANRVNDSTPLAPDQVVGVARILVPLVGHPAIWAWTDAWFVFGLWAALMVLAVWSARFALIEKYNPWPRRYETHATKNASDHDVTLIHRDPANVEPVGESAGDG